MRDFSELTELQVDALREISNIGSGNAATSLSQLLGRKIDMSVPKANIATFAQLVEMLGGAESEVAGGYLRVDGNSPMGILFLLPKKQVYYFLDLLFGRPQGTTGELDELNQSALREIVNILAGSYLNALSSLTGQAYVPTVPALAVDMLGAILGEVLEQVGEISDYALVMENVFIEQEKSISGHFFLLPEPQTLDTILRALGVL